MMTNHDRDPKPKQDRSGQDRARSGSSDASGGSPDRRETSLGDRILAWARESGEPFGPSDVAKHFGVTPEEATSVLGTLARRNRGIQSPSRGVYQFLAIGRM